MKVVVIGGTGLIGTKLVEKLDQLGHEVVAASRRQGVNAVTGEGLAEALAGAEVVADVSNSPSFEDKAALEFFETSTRNLLAAGVVAGVKHHVALSVVGIDHLPEHGYCRAKLAQESLITASPIPYTILRATQFFEFLGAIAQISTVGDTVRLSPALFQPLAADDVVAALIDIIVGEPYNGIIEVAGPQAVPMNEMIGRFLSAQGDTRQVVADVQAGYFGAAIDDTSLTPGDKARLGATSFEEWMKRTGASV